MKILFMMPTWSAISETWLQRMIEQLEDEISLVASFNAQRKWNNKIDGFSLKLKRNHPNIFVQLASHIHFFFLARYYNKKFRHEIRKRNIDTILINFADLAILSTNIWEKMDLNVFVHTHGYDIHFDSFHYEKPEKKVWPEKYIEYILKLSEKVTFIVNSKNSLNRLRRIGIPEEKLKLKYFGVKKQDNTKTIKSRQNRKGSVKLLFLGRLIDSKGPDLVIKSFELLCEKGVNAELTIAGDGELMPICTTMKNISKYTNRIKIIGSVNSDEANNLYIKSDIFLNFHRTGPLTNREEAFGVTIIEAMSFALPVITGNSGGPSEIIENGQTGYLIDNIDIEDYVDKLVTLCNDKTLRISVGTRAADFVQKHFSIRQEKSRLIEILNNKNISSHESS